MYNELYNALDKVENLLHHSIESRNVLTRRVIDWMAASFNRTSLHSCSLSDYMKQRFLGRGEFYLVESNDLSILIDGLSSRNFKYTKSTIDFSSGRWPGFGA